jgi:hypothetical protein
VGYEDQIEGSIDSENPRIAHVKMQCQSPQEVMYSLISLDRLDAFNVSVDVIEERHEFGSRHQAYLVLGSIDGRSSSYALEMILREHDNEEGG